MNPAPTPANPVPPAGAAPVPFTVRAHDGYLLHGQAWRHAAAPGGAPRPVVIVNSATSVRSRFYARFAEFLFREGFDVLCYDYRGIGASRPRRLRGFGASWADWGGLDFEAVLEHAARSHPDQPIDVVGHSIGGFLIGFARSNHRIRRIVTVGAQHAYWRDYATARRYPMYLKWHLVMPAVSALLGYFPGRTLGWLEDTPRGVVRDWSGACARFDERSDPLRRGVLAESGVLRNFPAVTAPILAISTTDDSFGTVPAIERVLHYFRGAAATHLRIAPADIGRSAIGHFSFFHAQHAATLWPIALAWLRNGSLPAEFPGTLVPREPAR